MELLIQLLPLILSAMNTVPQFQQAIRNGNPTVQAVENLGNLARDCFQALTKILLLPLPRRRCLIPLG
jgi:hypothetical protein